ncbi:MAG: hypothetical protein KatS3mg058_2184 [Roseiflexus sp.]|nr:MAG: hypothetical protein KatS3mg058_2184 [Roseiflexus sp.]
MVGPLAPLHKCEINLALRRGRAPRASPQMRDKSRATPWSGPSRLSTNARYISRYAVVGPLAPLHKCEIHLALRRGRAPCASRLAPLTSPQMRDISRATPWSGPLRFSTNARYISRYAMVGSLAPLHKCEIHLALRHGRAPRASSQMRDTSRATPWLGPLRLSTNARYISRYAMVGPLALLHKCEIHLALRHGRAPRASPQMRDKSRATPWSGPLRLSTNAR